MTLFFQEKKNHPNSQKAMTPSLSIKTDISVSGPFNVQKNTMLTPIEKLTSPNIQKEEPYVAANSSGLGTLNAELHSVPSPVKANPSYDIGGEQPSVTNGQHMSGTDSPVLVCIAPFEGQSKNELTTHMGDTVRLLSKSVVKGWIFVCSTYEKGRAGWIPKDTVKVLDFVPSKSHNSGSSSHSSTSTSTTTSSCFSYTESPSSSKDTITSQLNYRNLITPWYEYQQQQKQLQLQQLQRQQQQMLQQQQQQQQQQSQRRQQQKLRSEYSGKRQEFDSYSSPLPSSEFSPAHNKQLETPPATPLPSKRIPLPSSVPMTSTPKFSNLVRNKTFPIAPTSQQVGKKAYQPDRSSSPIRKMPRERHRFPYSNIRVTSAHCTSNRFWYRIDAVSQSRHVHLCRFYQDFYNLQVEIMMNQDKLGGSVNVLPKLPNLISPADNMSQDGMNARCVLLNRYLCSVVSLVDQLQNNFLLEIILSWMRTRTGDFEHSSDLTETEILRLLSPKEVSGKNKFDSDPQLSVPGLPQRQQFKQNQIPRPLANDTAMYTTPHMNEELDDAPTAPLFCKASPSALSGGSVRHHSSSASIPSSRNKVQVNFKVLDGESSFVLRLPKDINVHDLKLTVAGQINKYLSDFNLNYKDEKHSLFKPLRSNGELLSSIKDALRFGSNTILLKIA